MQQIKRLVYEYGRTVAIWESARDAEPFDAAHFALLDWCVLLRWRQLCDLGAFADVGGVLCLWLVPWYAAGYEGLPTPVDQTGVVFCGREGA